MPTTYKLQPEAEAACIRQMVADPSVLPKIHRHLRPEGFVDPSAKTLASAALAYHKTRGRAPTWVALAQELRERVNAGRLKPGDLSAAVGYMEEARNRPPLDSEYVVDLILERERVEGIWQALEEGAKLHAAGKMDDAVALMVRAGAIGKVDREMGVDYLRDLSQRTEARKSSKQPKRWGTGIPDLDDLMDGGPSLDNPLGCIEAAPKNGKSLFLGHVAMHIVASGGLVVFFSMENGLGEVLKRVDASIAAVPIKEVHARADEVNACVIDWHAGVRGRLHVVELPQRTTTVRDINAYLDILAVEEDFHPHCVITDYPKEMSPSDPEGLDREDQRLAEVYRELRAMHKKRGHIGWTAAQLSREGSEKKMASRGSTGGAYAIEQLVDVMASIGRTEEEEQQGLVRFGVVASRFCASGTQTQPMASSYDMGRIIAAGVPRP